MSQETGSCFASNKYIANIVNVTPERVSKIISSLKDKRYVRIKLKYKTDSKEIEERQITPIVENILYRIIDKFHETIGKFISWICKKFDMRAEDDLIIDFEKETRTYLDVEKHIKQENKEKGWDLEI